MEILKEIPDQIEIYVNKNTLLLQYSNCTNSYHITFSKIFFTEDECVTPYYFSS